MSKTKNLSRRDFIKTTAVGVGAATLAGLGSKEVNAKAPSITWDKEADVVVLGYGGAGAVAAITAADKGAKVLIVEKMPENAHYPNTKMSGGSGHYAKDPVDAAAYFKAAAFGIGLPKELGDPPEAYPNYPPELVDGIVDVWGKGVTETAGFMRSIAPSLEVNETIPSKDFPTFPGGKTYGYAGYVPTYGVVTKTAGQTLFKALSDAVNKRGIEIFWNSPAKRLIKDESGEIYGVVATRQGKDINIKAKRAVILTTGGFEYDEELKKAFIPGWKWVFIGNPANTGDGVRMAMDSGALLGHMYHNAARVVCGAMLKELGTGVRARCNAPGMILVDNYGRRYANEDQTDTSPQRYQFYNLVIHLNPTTLDYQRIPSWLIFDEKTRKLGPIITTTYGVHAVGIYKWSNDNMAEVDKGWILKGNTLEELAANMAKQPDCQGRMSAKSMVESVNQFNQLCKGGKDLDFGRKTALVPIEAPPYYATAMYPGGPNTEGGPIRNAKSQVMGMFKKPIPRLYAAGELGSVWSFAYQCGGNIAECIIFGRIAGENAAAEKPWG
jgi:3-oxosteroid 1-dehydrogenase